MNDIKLHQTEPSHRACYKGENYYCTVDGKNVGNNKTMFFRTKREAMAVSRRFVLALENTKNG